MRPVMHGDLVAAARVLFGAEPQQRDRVLRALFRAAETADRHRIATGRMHPDHGDGSLMAAALSQRPPPEPTLENSAYCACLAAVLTALAARPRGTESPG